MKFHLQENPALPRRKFTPLILASSCFAMLTLLVFAVGSQAAIYDFTPANGPILASPTASGVSLSVNGQNPINVNSGTPASTIRNMNGVVAWSVGGTVYSYVFDPTRLRWVGTNSSHAASAISDLSSADGVVAWSVQGGSAFYQVYDPASGAWVRDSGPGPIAQTRILNTNGVVAWSLLGTTTSIHFRTYDPTRTGWMSRNVGPMKATSDLRNLDGIVAWSSLNLDNTATIYFDVYDPSRGQWREGTAAAPSVTSLRIVNSQVLWNTPTEIQRGYNPSSGAWGGTAFPLAYFAVSTSAANAPFVVSFIDMSIGANSWSWNFGDGLGSSTKRSPTYRYTNFGQFTAMQTVNGSSATTRVITTDLIAPTGTNLINNGSPFTTNPIVTLTLSVSDNSGLVTEMRFSNTNGLMWSAWEPRAGTKTWVLSPGNGAKTVYAQFRDAAGNISAPASDSIQLDTTPAPVVSFISTNVLEAAGSVAVRVFLDHPLSQTVSVRYSTANGTAVAPDDYTAKTGLLTFPPNETNASFVIQIAADGLVELNETVLLNFSDAINAYAGPQGTILIMDDETPTISFVSTNVTFGEEAGTGVVMVKLDAASAKTVRVAFQATNGTATAEVDFLPVQGTLTFAPGETLQSFAVPLIDETLDEFSETVFLTLSDPVNASLGPPSASTLTILDNDNPVVFFSRSNYIVLENSGAALVSVWLSKPFALEVAADYSAFGGTATPGFPGDYFAASGRLTFPPNTTNQIFFVNLVNDHEPEGDESVRLRLSNFVNGGPGLVEADIIISDDDGPPRLEAPRLNVSQHFQATITGKTNQRFALEVSTNLVNWLPLAVLTNTTGTLQYSDPETVNWPNRFYRTRVP